MASLLLAIIYIAFISLGLPDSLLGSAWPTIYPELGVSVSYAGVISMIIALGTVVSSLMSDRLTRALGTGRVMVLSVGTTAIALFGFSISSAFWMLILWAIPYGLGAGSVDASLNNYVALHYESRHMSWLHCMWGIGAAVSPYIMSYALTSGRGWNMGYRYVSILQIGLTVILFISLPLWKGRDEGVSEELRAAAETASEAESGALHGAVASAGSSGTDAATAPCAAEAESPVRHAAVSAKEDRPMTLPEIIRLPGAKEIFICFFCYSAVEQTSGLWAASFLTLQKGMASEEAAAFASMFFIGIAIGRAACGFITMKLNDTRMIRMGLVIIAAGIAALLIPGPTMLALTGFILVGLGCAPIYPCIIHSTPAHFGADKSQAVIGVQMASAYIGTSFMPPLFGILAGWLSTALLPFYLLLFLVLMAVMHEQLLKKAAG